MLGTFKSAATSISRGAKVLAMLPKHRGVFCAMQALHVAFACLFCATQRLSPGKDRAAHVMSYMQQCRADSAAS